MSDELVSISNFLDWAEEKASKYAEWACDAITEAEGHTGHGNSDRLLNSCPETIVCLSIRLVYAQVETRVYELPMVDDELIERSVLLDMLSTCVNANFDRVRYGIRRAAEYGRRGCYIDMLRECQDVMHYEDARRVYHCMATYVRCMPTSGMIEGHSQKGGD